MTAAAAHGDRLRWIASFLLILTLHVGAALVLALRPSSPPVLFTPPAVMIELTPPPPDASVEKPAPEPVVEPAQPIPPVPASEPPPPEIVPAPIEPPPPPEVVEPPTRQVERLPEEVLPVPPPVPVQKPPPPRAPRPPRPAVPPATAPAPLPTPSAPAAPPPSSTSAAEAASNWQSRLLAHLTRYKRYPASAQMRREQGVALLRVTMTRLGAVTGFRLERSSGHQLLDQEVLDLVQRAQPLPPEMTKPTVEIVVPIRFELR